MSDGIIAFHELVLVKAWAESSARGPSIRIALSTRDSLAIFERVTKRAGKRAGQRYHAIWQNEDEQDKLTPDGGLPMDLWFAGANWAHQDGATVKFAVTADDFEHFRTGFLHTGGGEGAKSYWLTLVQVDEDENPVDQGKAERLEDALKGGPHSKRVAMLCQERAFQKYAAFRSGFKAREFGIAETDQWVKGYCGVASKKEFDHNEAVWVAFQTRILGPYLRWCEGDNWRSEEQEATEDEHEGSA